MQSTERPQDWQTTVRILWVTQFATMVAFSCSLPFVPLYILELGIPDPRRAALWAGFVAGGSGISMALFAPVWGALADRFSRKLMLQRALLGATFTLLLMGFAQSAAHLLLLRFIQGSLTGTTTAVNTLVASITPREHLGRVLGAMQMSIFAGSTIGPFFGGVLADTVGFRAAFIITSAVCLSTSIAVLTLVHEPKHGSLPLPSLRLPRVRLPRQLRLPRLVGRPSDENALNTVLMLAPVIFMAQFALMAARPIFPLFVAELAATDSMLTRAGVSPQDFVATIAGLLVATTGVVATLCSPITGRFIESSRVRLLLLAAVAGSALANVGHAVVASLLQLWLARVVMGACNGVWAPTYSATVGLSVPAERRGLAFGIANSASSLGNALGPVVGGYIGAMLGMRAVFVAAAGALLLAALWLAVRVNPPAPVEPED